MSPRLRIISGLALSLVAGCAAHHPTIPSGDIAIDAYKMGAMAALEPMPSYTVSSAPGSPPRGELPQWTRFYPVWAPNGKWIATVDRDSYGLVLHSTIDSTTVKLPTPLTLITDVAWFPDSSRIAFSGFAPDRSSNIYTIDLACLTSAHDCPGDVRELVAGTSPSISHDAKWLAYVGTAWECRDLDPDCTAVFVSPIDASSPAKNITSSLEPILSRNDWPQWGCLNPQWSPRETKLVFSCGFDVYIYDLASDALQNLTSMVTPYHTEHNFPEWWPRDFTPSWTGDGERVLFLSDRDDDLAQSGSDFISNALFLMRPDGTDVQRITTQSDQMIVRYTWIFH